MKNCGVINGKGGIFVKQKNKNRDIIVGWIIGSKIWQGKNNLIVG